MYGADSATFRSVGVLNVPTSAHEACSVATSTRPGSTVGATPLQMPGVLRELRRLLEAGSGNADVVEVGVGEVGRVVSREYKPEIEVRRRGGRQGAGRPSTALARLPHLFGRPLPR